MTTYVVCSKKTERYYLCQVQGNFPTEGEVKCVCIHDKYKYTIPVEDLIVVLRADEQGIF